jgi:hypothetical protein
VARSRHAALLLPSGKVLVVAGVVADASGASTPLASAEVL